VVSVPSLELLLAQPADRRRAIIGNAPVKVAIEAAVRWGWDAVIGPDGEFIGMHGFGASAPAKDLFKHFGITAEAAVNAALKRLG
jgi:transketolase